MKINLDFRLMKNRIFSRKLCIVGLIFILVCQISLEFINIKESFIMEEVTNENEKNDELACTKDLNKIIDELNYNNISFSEIRKEESGYNIKVIVEGNFENFKEKLKYINKYSIKDYQLKLKNDNLKVIATLNY